MVMCTHIPLNADLEDLQCKKQSALYVLNKYNCRWVLFEFAYVDGICHTFSLSILNISIALS